MSERKLQIYSSIIGLIVGSIFGWMLLTLYKWYTTPPGYRHLAKNFVFTIDPKFTDYFLAANDLFDLKFQLAKVDITEPTRKKLLNQMPKTYDTIKSTNRALDKVLHQAIKHYGEPVKPDLEKFMDWKNSVDINRIPYDKNYVWGSKFNNFQEKIYHQLRRSTGIYNIGSVDDAYIMQVLPEAKEALKKNPNDPKLCTVMQELEEKPGPETIAKMIAFVDIGAQYCNKYYHKRFAWGITSSKQEKVSAKNKYANLPYVEYYQKYVLPMVPAAIKRFKNKEENGLICKTQGLLGASREPERDAMRVAYRGEGKHYCPKLTSLEQKNYMNTSYVCIMVNKFFCVDPHQCDAFERCKPMNGVLFSN